MSDPVIAVIEANPGTSLLLDKLLISHGFDVCLWPSQEGAVAFIHDRQPDLIIVDLYLAEAELSINVLTQLGHDPQTRQIPMIICAGEPEGLSAEALRGLERYDVLPAPWLSDDFGHCLCEHVTGLIVHPTSGR